MPTSYVLLVYLRRHQAAHLDAYMLGSSNFFISQRGAMAPAGPWVAPPVPISIPSSNQRRKLEQKGSKADQRHNLFLPAEVPRVLLASAPFLTLNVHVSWSAGASCKVMQGGHGIWTGPPRSRRQCSRSISWSLMYQQDQAELQIDYSVGGIMAREQCFKLPAWRFEQDHGCILSVNAKSQSFALWTRILWKLAERTTYIIQTERTTCMQTGRTIEKRLIRHKFFSVPLSKNSSHIFVFLFLSKLYCSW